ncbi:Zinc finger protein 236 [Frankliniella fusca]|uniref:Zinc finger protein 236 n=1 Tax=Frankliniella fusca TaxID=407009 RepID=A0AAE1LGD0_9NEOP|nr:Zinc finger protein 236 [Frankliniella fusca]
MESVRLLAEPSEVLGGHVLSLSAGDVLRDNGIIFTQDTLTSSIITTDSGGEEVQTFMSLPVHLLQDNSFVGPVLVKNAAGNTFLIDPRQCNVLGDGNDDGQAHLIIAPSSESLSADQSTSNIMGFDMDFPYITNVGNVVLSESGSVAECNMDVNSSAIPQLESRMIQGASQMLQGANKLLPEGMCIDMSQLSIVTSDGVVSYVTAVSGDNALPESNEVVSALPQPDTVFMKVCEGVDFKEGVTFASEATIPSDDRSNIEILPAKLKRGRGRPRKNDPNQEDVMDPPVGKPPYKCDTCDYEAALWGRLKRHKESHKNEKPHRCKVCGASYNVEANLTLHMATHNQEQLKCPECQREFSRVASLRSHLMLHEREDNLFCTECGDEFALQYQLDSHVMEHQDEWVSKNIEKIHECQKCYRQFSKASALKEHMRDHVKVKHSLVRRKHDRTQDRSEFSHKCSTCGKVFQKPSQLVRHMRIHTGERPFPCSVCGKAFSQKGSLQIHMTKHNGEKPYQCDFCSARFSQKGNLRAHIQRVHSIPQQGTVTFRCTECPCIFRKLGSLNSHMGRAHSQVDTGKSLKKDNVCPEQMMQVNVNQIMAQIAALKTVNSCDDNQTTSNIHIEEREHTGSVNLPSNEDSMPTKKTESSDILQEAISKSGLEGKPDSEVSSNKATAVIGFITLADKALDGTVRRYTIRQRKVGGIRWHQCSFCCKEFKKPSDLVRHIRIHTHEKPFKCPHCFRAFSVKSTLTAHIRTHGGLKRYSCSDCNKKFSTTSSLKVHQRLHNGERPFPCSVCNRTFRTSGHRQTHWLQHCDPLSTLSSDAKKRRRKSKKSEIQPGENLPDVLLGEPIVITESGLVQTDTVKPEKESGPRLHNCDQCTASFRKKNHLRNHLRIHSGERPFQCNICSRSFVSNGVLKTHILTHDSVKAFKCEICPTAFSTQGSLKRHQSMHSDSKPFMCPYCHKTFKHKLACKKHIKNHKVEVARAVARQANEFQEPQFVVSVVDGFNGGEIIVPDFQAFSNNAPGGADNLEETETDKLVDTGGVITHTLLADASGTITLPASLTQESIREIEDTLNQQLSCGGPNAIIMSNSHQSNLHLNTLTVNTTVQQNTSVIDFAAASEAAHAEDIAAAANLAASEVPAGTNLSDEHKESALVSESSDLSSAIFGPTFDQQTYDACTFPTITLQGDHLSLAGIEQGETLSANMEAILPQSCGNERRRADQNDDEIDAHGGDIHELSLPDAEVQTLTAEAIEESSISRPRSSSTSCETCGQAFKRVSQLKVHMRAVHLSCPRPHTCSYCTRSFSSANGLRLHSRTHTHAVEKSIICVHCSLSFTTNASLSRHMAVHTDRRPFSCAKCSSAFRTQLQLRKHTKIHDPTLVKSQRISKKVPAIIFSEEQTSALANQDVDMAGSVSEKMLIASAIEVNRDGSAEGCKKFDTEPAFANKCKFCPKSFRKPSDLVRHVRIHTGERPFRCDHCYRSFTVKSTLNSHRKTHISDLPKMFACHVCNLRFSTKGSLKVHMRLHTGSKPFKCPLCPLRFRTSGHRKAHLQSHAHSGNGSRARKTQQALSITEEETNQEMQEILTHQIITEDGSVVEVDTAALLAAGGTLDGSPLQLQINDQLLQQLQFQSGGNVVIQENGTVHFVSSGDADHGTDCENIENPVMPLGIDQEQSVASNQDLPSLLPTIEEISAAQEQVERGKQQETDDISGMHFEIHTDEHGQIVNIHQALDGSGVILADLNIADVTKVNIDGSEFQILDGVTEVNPENDLDANGFVTLDISDIIMAAPNSKRKEKISKSKSDSSGQTAHTCSVCGKIFGKPSQLQRHARIHTGERPFPCTQCWKAFNQKNALKAHMKRHTGERPFKCPHCEHAFTQRGNLKTHIGRAHPHSAGVENSKKRKMLSIPKNNILDDVSFRLDLEGVVGDLFPQMQAATEAEAD